MEELKNINYLEEDPEPFYIKDPELYKRYKKSLPPKEAYYYFPKGEEIHIPTKKPEKSLRRIYVNTEYTELEKKWIDDYKKIINAHPENMLPDYWDDSWNLLFIYSTECKLEKSYKRMIEYIDWTKKTFPIYISPGDKVIKLLNSGFLYAYGRDHQFRPIIIVQPYILERDIKKYTSDDVVRASFFLCQYILNKMLIPGQIENWIMFLNLKDLSVLRFPEPFRKLISALSDYFPARLYKSYIIHMSKVARILYLFVRNFLDEITVKKVVVLSGTEDEKRFNDINPENLEEKFGGRAPDAPYEQPNGLFPPIMPSENIYKNGEDPKDILISEKEYMEKYKLGQIPKCSISPYILEKNRKEKLKEEQKKKENEHKLLKRELSKKQRIKLKSFKELSINTRWNILPEHFDKTKFKTNTFNLIEEIGNLSNKKKNFCSSLSTLTSRIVTTKATNI